MAHRILFVCTGNVCRSPMAEAMFNEQARRRGENEQFQAYSAGTWAMDHQSASGHAQTAMARRGLDINLHRARTITALDLDASDLVIVMTRSQRDALAAEFPAQRGKLRLMSELSGRSYDIADPYGSSLAEYDHCAQELYALIETGYDQIKAWITQEKD